MTLHTKRLTCRPSEMRMFGHTQIYLNIWTLNAVSEWRQFTKYTYRERNHKVVCYHSAIDWMWKHSKAFWNHRVRWQQQHQQQQSVAVAFPRRNSNENKIREEKHKEKRKRKKNKINTENLLQNGTSNFADPMLTCVFFLLHHHTQGKCQV